MTVRSVPSQEGFVWNLREIVVLAALAVVFGVLYWGWVAAWGAAQAVLGDFAQNVFIGGWLVVGTLGVYIVRKPLSGVLTEIAAAFVEVAFLGSPIGALLLLTGFVQGAGSEAPFTLTGYKRFGWPMMLVSGASAALFSFVYSTIRFGWLGLDPGVLLLKFVLHILSGIILCGVLAKLIGDALLRTGVLANFAIGRAAAGT